MTICNCCGQQIEARAEARSAETTDAIWADETLIQCCRHAQHIAQEQAAGAVEIAHFVLALAQSTEAPVLSIGLDWNDLAEAAARAMATAGSSQSPGATPSMSSDMLVILDRAQQQTQSTDRDSVTLNSVVDTLLNDARDLQSADFLRDVQIKAETRDASNRDHRRASQSTERAQRERHDDGHSVRERPTITTADPFQLRLDTNGDNEWEDRDRSDRDTTASSSPSQDGRERGRRWHQRPDRDRKTHERAQRREHSRHRSRENEHQGRRDSQRVQQGTTGDAKDAMKDFDRRLQEMQRLLADVASQTKAIQSAQQQRDRQASTAVSNTTANRNVAFSVEDMARLERLLHRLEAQDRTNAGAGNGNGSGSGGGRNGNRQSRGDRPLRRAWRRRSLRREHTGERSSRTHLRSDNDGGSPNERTWSSRSSTARLAERSTGTPINQHDETEWQNTDDSAGEGDPQAKRFYLEIDDEIVSAPSIGPRTADRLTPHGIQRVRDLLAADAADLAERVNARHITARRIEDWQMQARLVCTVPWLRGTHAQMLVGSGYTTPGDINEADIDTLCADILQFAGTRDGQRILRSGPPPEMEKIVKWAEFAAQAELDRAA